MIISDHERNRITSLHESSVNRNGCLVLKENVLGVIRGVLKSLPSVVKSAGLESGLTNLVSKSELPINIGKGIKKVYGPAGGGIFPVEALNLASQGNPAYKSLLTTLPKTLKDGTKFGGPVTKHLDDLFIKVNNQHKNHISIFKNKIDDYSTQFGGFATNPRVLGHNLGKGAQITKDGVHLTGEYVNNTMRGLMKLNPQINKTHPLHQEAVSLLTTLKRADNSITQNLFGGRLQNMLKHLESSTTNFSKELGKYLKSIPSTKGIIPTKVVSTPVTTGLKTLSKPTPLSTNVVKTVRSDPATASIPQIVKLSDKTAVGRTQKTITDKFEGLDKVMKTSFTHVPTSLKSEITSLSTRYKDLTNGIVKGKPVTTKYDMNKAFQQLVADTEKTSLKLQKEVTSSSPAFFKTPKETEFLKTHLSHRVKGDYTRQDPVVSMKEIMDWFKLHPEKFIPTT